jgi:hypothetical protein
MDNPNATLDIERLTARVISQGKYIELADKHIALLERIVSANSSPSLNMPTLYGIAQSAYQENNDG